ncbi:MAG: MraY family glycosyltransferase [Arenibacter algicola]
MAFVYELFSNLYFLGIVSVCIPLLLCYRMYPVIIYAVRSKNLMDEPGDRSMHTSKTPTLGGVGLFIAFSLSFAFLGLLVDLSKPDLIKLISLLSATIMLMFLGVKDDLFGLAPKKKFMVQIVASLMVIILADLRIISFEGIFGLGELPYHISVIFTLFVFLLIINAFNLIDGLDGLAGSVALLSSLSFGTFFFINGRYLFVLISFVLIGALLGFLRYNLSPYRKIFMGDSGSMFIGFLLAFQAVGFLSYNATIDNPVTNIKAPIMAMAILSYPLLDTLRVFAIRISQKRSPFSADRNHIHHRLIDLGITHKQASLFVVVLNSIIIELAFLIRELYINVQLYIIIIAVPLLYVSPWLFVRKQGKLKLVKPKPIKWSNIRSRINNFLG